MAKELTFEMTADTASVEAALENLKTLSQSFGSQLTGALKMATVSGKDLDDILRRIGLNLAGMALEVATAGPEEMKRKVEGDAVRWQKLAQELDIKPLD